MKNRIRTRVVCFLALAGFGFVSLFQSSSALASKNAPPATVVRVTPPAPVFDDAKRLDELAARRKHVAEAIGPGAMLVMFSAEPRVSTNDVDYAFRQENNLFYLTNLNQKGATLVMMRGTQMPEILFLPRRNPTAETWTGHMYSAEEAARLSGIKEIWAAGEFEPFMKAMRAHEEYQPKPENILLSDRTGRTMPPGFDPPVNGVPTHPASLYLL